MKRKTSFNSVLGELDSIKKQLKEAYIFDDEMEGVPQGDEIQQDPSMGQEQPIQAPQQPQEGAGESEEEKAMHAQQIAQHEPIIMKMREIALQGLQKYSEEPTNSLYEFFKSVFLDSDKVLTGAGGKK